MKKKLDGIQGLRTLACVGILCSHCDVGDWGAWGVSIFFVISGFVMVYSYWDKDINLKLSFKFAIKKILKLYPLYILTLGMAVLYELIWIKDEMFVKTFLIKELLQKVIVNICLLQTWMIKDGWSTSLNVVAWYLSAIFFMFLAFPTILKLFRKCADFGKKGISIEICAIVLYIFAMATLINVLDWKNAWTCVVVRIGEFLGGCNCGYIYLLWKDRKRTVLMSTVYEGICVVLVLLSQYVFINGTTFLGTIGFRKTILFLPSSIWMVYLFACNEGFFSKLFTNRATLIIAKYSPYIFLLHCIVINYLRIIWHKIFGFNIEPNNVLLVIVTFVVSLIGSYIYVILENKVKNWIC